MWAIEGRAIRIWVSDQGHVSFGGTATAHQCRPSTDQWNETGELEEASRVSRLPLEWRATIDTAGDFDRSLRDQMAIVGKFRRPEHGVAAFKVLDDFVSFSFQLSEPHFINAYDALKTYLGWSGLHSSYVLTHEFLGTRHPTSDSLLPTVPEFYRQGYPYVSEEAPAITFVFGQTGA